jgi:hypothetical protein
MLERQRVYFLSKAARLAKFLAWIVFDRTILPVGWVAIADQLTGKALILRFTLKPPCSCSI